MIRMLNSRINMTAMRYLNQQICTQKTQKSKLLQDSFIFQSKKERFSFYNENKNNGRALLDSINFFEGAIGADRNEYFYFGEGGQEQMIPQSAIPRINTNSLEKLSAKDNKLCLTSKSYYAYRGSDGNEYACAFNGKVISRAFSEATLNDDMNRVSAKCRGNTVTVMNILSDVIRGSVGGFCMLEKASIKNALASVGITPGKFTISVDGEDRNYYMTEKGEIYTEKRALKEVEQFNKINWLNGLDVGDTVTVFGREYPIGEDRHIHVPTEDFWTNGTCNYGNKK